jgi:hypothetical protein
MHFILSCTLEISDCDWSRIRLEFTNAVVDVSSVPAAFVFLSHAATLVARRRARSSTAAAEIRQVLSTFQAGIRWA